MQCKLRLNQLKSSRSSRYSDNRSSKLHPTGHSISTLASRQQHSPGDNDRVHSGIQLCRSVSPSMLQPSSFRHTEWLSIAAAVLVQSQLLCPGGADAAVAELLEANVSNEGNVPSKLSAAGDQAGPSLSSLVSGTNKKQIEGCTRKCVPTCTRGGEGAPGLGPISLRKEIVVFKEGFRSRQYCLSECAQVCSLISRKAGDSSASEASNTGVQGRVGATTQEQQSSGAAAAPVP